MSTETQSKTYHVRNSMKCFRFKPEAFTNHGPERKGIYELVTFDDFGNAKVLFVGAAFTRTIHDSLVAHADGSLAPKADDLFKAHPNLYFDYIEEMDAKTQDDAQDIYWWLVQKHKPPFNDPAVTHSGRYASIDVVELD